METTSTYATTPSVRSELSALIRLALPISLAQFGLVSMGLVDTAIIGRVSVDDLASVALGRSIFFAASSFGMGIASALEPLAAQALGARESERAWAAALTTLRASAIVALPSLALAFVATLAFVSLGIEVHLIPGVQRYLVGNTPGFFAFFAFLVGKSFLNAHGRTAPVLRASIWANVVNFVACNLLIRGDDALAWLHLPALGLPRLGAFGAGLAGSIGSVVLVLVIFRAALEYRPEKSEPVPLRVVFRLGLPIGTQFLAEIGIFTLAALLVGRFGAKMVSAHQIALGLASFTFMAAIGIGGATAVRVGHTIGAGESPRQVGLLGIGLGVSVMSLSALSFATLPGLLIRAFTPDTEVIQLGVSLLSIAAIFQLFDGVQGVAAGALRGAGDVRFPFLANLAAHWLIGFPVALICGFWLGWGAQGVWWGLTAGLFSISVLLLGRFWVLSKRRIRRVEEVSGAAG